MVGVGETDSIRIWTLSCYLGSLEQKGYLSNSRLNYTYARTSCPEYSTDALR